MISKPPWSWVVCGTEVKEEHVTGGAPYPPERGHQGSVFSVILNFFVRDTVDIYSYMILLPPGAPLPPSPPAVPPSAPAPPSPHRPDDVAGPRLPPPTAADPMGPCCPSSSPSSCLLSASTISALALQAPQEPLLLPPLSPMSPPQPLGALGPPPSEALPPPSMLQRSTSTTLAPPPPPSPGLMPPLAIGPQCAGCALSSPAHLSWGT